MKGNETLMAVFSGVTMAVLIALLFSMNTDNRTSIALVDAKIETTKLDLTALQVRVDRIETSTVEMLSILKRLDAGLDKLFEDKHNEEKE